MRQLEKAREMLSKLPRSTLYNPIILSSLMTGLVDGHYYKEALDLYKWCLQHSPSSPTQSILRSVVTVSSVVECFRKTKQFEKAIDLFQNTQKEGIVMIPDVYLTIATICDSEPMWRKKYREQVKRDSIREPEQWE